ncbi:hypothetical protein [Candidatus Methylacidithermus pantelleriae]|nr:hypothetical protein [Candidatus Methylacidithermus pantelleriae]
MNNLRCLVWLLATLEGAFLKSRIDTRGDLKTMKKLPPPRGL